jgi:hypothetical protein
MQSSAKQRGVMGILTGGFTGSRRRREGLVVARSFSAPMRPVVVTSGGPPVEGRGKMKSPSSREAP